MHFSLLRLINGAETHPQPSHPRRQHQRKQKSANECKQNCSHIKFLQILIAHYSLLTTHCSLLCCSLLCYSLLWETKPVLYPPADEPKIVDRKHRVAGGGVKSSHVRWPWKEGLSKRIEKLGPL